MHSALDVSRACAVLAMAPDLRDRLFTPDTLQRLRRMADVDTGLVLTEFRSPAARAALARAEVLLTGWECPPVDADALAAAPHLRAIVHAAGSVKSHLTPACFDRGIVVSSAARANAEPVAEYTLAMILLAGKGVPLIAHAYRTRRARIDLRADYPTIGNFQRTIGLIGASRIGRRVIELLRPFDLNLLVSDPYLDPAEARSLDVQRVQLDDLLGASDIVSLHAPSLPSTRHMLDRRRLALMRDGATFINTARGALVDQDALIDELVRGRINAVLDVTEPWVPPPDSPLYSLPNVVLTPHMAGSLGVELQRLGAFAVAELERYTSGQPFLEPVTPREFERIA